MFGSLMFSVIVLFLSIFSAPAFAHPHVWVYTDVEIDATNKAFSKIHVSWEFDEMYSAAYVMDADTNRNKKLDKTEVLQLKEEVFGKSSELGQFMYLAVGGQQFLPKNFENVDISLSDKGQLIYAFDIVLSQKFPLSAATKISFFDPSFYVGFEQHPDLTLSGASACSAWLSEDDSIRIYGGLIMPEVYTFSCEG